MRAAVQLSVLGYKSVPHLAARSLQSRAALTGIIRECNAAGIGEVFVIGGDRKRPAGIYESALPVLEDIAQYSGGTMRAAIAGYPEGHPFVGPVDVLEALLAKQHLASNVVTQMCFSPEFLSRKGPLALKLLSGDRYSPASLITGLGGQHGILAGIHLYSFSSIESVHSGTDDGGNAPAVVRSPG